MTSQPRVKSDLSSVELAVFKGGREPPYEDWLIKLDDGVTFCCNWRDNKQNNWRLHTYKVLSKGTKTVCLWNAEDDLSYDVDSHLFCQVLELIEIKS